MDPTALLLFAGTLALAAAAPGPSVVARTPARGRDGTVPLVAGIILDDMVRLTGAAVAIATK